VREAGYFFEEYRGLSRKKSGLTAEKDGEGRGLFALAIFEMDSG
jgi:hypothetical protein